MRRVLARLRPFGEGRVRRCRDNTLGPSSMCIGWAVGPGPAVRLDAARLAPRIDGQRPVAALFPKEGHMRQMMKIAKYVFVVALFSLLSMGSGVAQENAEWEGAVSHPAGK